MVGLHGHHLIRAAFKKQFLRGQILRVQRVEDDEFAFEIEPVAERLRGGALLALVGRADRAEPATALSADRADPFPTTPVTRGSSVYRDERTVASPVQMSDAFF